MSIADKLLAVAENEQRVFDAGKLALLRSSKYMNATASGAVVAVNDVSPVKHGVAVQLSSDTVTDFSSVTVKRYGKNLLENNTDNLTFLKRQNRYGYRVRLPAGTYTVHAEPIGEYINGIYLYHEAVDENEEKITDIGEATFNYPVVDAKLSNVTFTVDREFYYHIYAAATPTLALAKTHFNTFNVQLEVANTATPYMPYIEPTTYAPNADGTLTMPSLSPSMTLLTDTDGVTLD